MEAEKLMLANGKTASRVATPTLTATSDKSVKQVPVEIKKAIVFFIGGAGDKESYYFSGPFGNVLDAKEKFDLRADDLGTKGLYISHYLGYSEVKGSGDIKKYALDFIPSKAAAIYIVGHSLGGWNGAHLSKILSEKGYNVAMLVTLDPVGEGAFVWLGSNIYYGKPEPKAKFWINIRATPTKPDQSDSVADFGEQWIVAAGPNENYTINTNHALANTMFVSPLINGKSAADLVYASIAEHVGGGQ